MIFEDTSLKSIYELDHVLQEEHDLLSVSKEIYRITHLLMDKYQRNEIVKFYHHDNNGDAIYVEFNLVSEDFNLYESINLKNLDYSLFQNLSYEIKSNQITLSYSKSENIEIFGDVVIDYEAIYDKYGNVISITSSGDISEINITSGQTYSGEISGQIKYTYNQKISHETRL